MTTITWTLQTYLIMINRNRYMFFKLQVNVSKWSGWFPWLGLLQHLHNSITSFITWWWLFYHLMLVSLCQWAERLTKWRDGVGQIITPGGFIEWLFMEITRGVRYKICHSPWTSCKLPPATWERHHGNRVTYLPWTDCDFIGEGAEKGMAL